MRCCASKSYPGAATARPSPARPVRVKAAASVKAASEGAVRVAAAAALAAVRAAGGNGLMAVRVAGDRETVSPVTHASHAGKETAASTGNSPQAAIATNEPSA